MTVRGDQMNHLELFTDGGAIKINGKFYGSSSYVIKFQNKYFTTNFPVAEGTNNHYELKAIRDGLVALLRGWQCKTLDIWIISDSEYSIKSITKWSRNWRKINGVWYTSSGSPALNWELIMEIKSLLENFRSYKFIKVKSHISTNLEESYEKFLKINKIKMTFIDYLKLIRMNELCDSNITKQFNQKRREIANELGREFV